MIDDLAERGTNSPYINHFLSPDSIIPEQSQGVQAWDRYAYSNNNPVRYNDPSGHCVDPVCLAVLGAGIGFVGSVGFQVIENYSVSGNLKEAFQNVDLKTATKYAIAGAVAGATYGALSGGVVLAAGVSIAVDTSTVAGAALAGGLSTVAGGQAAALTDATWEFGDSLISQEKPTTSYGMEFVENAHNAGLFDGDQIVWDFGTGAVSGGLLQGITNITNSTGGITYVTQAAREGNAFAPGAFGSITRAMSKTAQELSQKWLDTKFNKLEQIIDF